MRNKILVVDDEPDIVELLSFNLKQAGFAIGTAFDGVEALRKARSMMPDLILLDLMLPKLDGLSVCEILRRNVSTSSIPVILLTGLTGELGRLAGLDAGATDYITKPFSPRLLVSKVDALLRKLDTPGAASTLLV
jgi:DNA-binding response OmpR family regulator